MGPSITQIVRLQNKFHYHLIPKPLPTMELCSNDNGTRGVRKMRFIKPASRWNCGHRKHK
jgi:hypothetical protein